MMTGARREAVVAHTYHNHHHTYHNHHHNGVETCATYAPPSRDNYNSLPQPAGEGNRNLLPSGDNNGHHPNDLKLGCCEGEKTHQHPGRRNVLDGGGKEGGGWWCECVGRRRVAEEEEEEVVGVGGGGVGAGGGEGGGCWLSVAAAPQADGSVSCRRLSPAPRCPSPHHAAKTTPQHLPGSSPSSPSCQAALRGNQHTPSVGSNGAILDKEEIVQRVITGDEIQIQLISSEILLKSRSEQSVEPQGLVVSAAGEEKPSKKKRKFIIILKGLLNKSKRNEKSKCRQRGRLCESGVGDSNRLLDKDKASDGVSASKYKASDEVSGSVSEASQKVLVTSSGDNSVRSVGGDYSSRARLVEGGGWSSRSSIPGERRSLPVHHHHQINTAQVDDQGGETTTGEASGASRGFPHSSQRSCSGGESSVGSVASTTCLGTHHKLTLLYHAALTTNTGIENGARHHNITCEGVVDKCWSPSVPHHAPHTSPLLLLPRHHTCTDTSLQRCASHTSLSSPGLLDSAVHAASQDSSVNLQAPASVTSDCPVVADGDPHLLTTGTVDIVCENSLDNCSLPYFATGDNDKLRENNLDNRPIPVFATNGYESVLENNLDNRPLSDFITSDSDTLIENIRDNRPLPEFVTGEDFHCVENKSDIGPSSDLVLCVLETSVEEALDNRPTEAVINTPETTAGSSLDAPLSPNTLDVSSRCLSYESLSFRSCSEFEDFDGPPEDKEESDSHCCASSDSDDGPESYGSDLRQCESVASVPQRLCLLQELPHNKCDAECEEEDCFLNNTGCGSEAGSSGTLVVNFTRAPDPHCDRLTPHGLLPSAPDAGIPEPEREPLRGSLSDSDQSDSSDDCDFPAVDDSVYDLQFDPYFYQGSISLEHIPDDQPIDYPCPYDVNGGYIAITSRQYNPNFTYIDSWSCNRVTAPGDLYRSQSHPEDISHSRYEDEPLDGNAPLHVFLSQPLPGQVSAGFSLETTLLRPRRRGEFSSLCSFGGSQLYTITEEAETDDPYDDSYTRRNYSESNLYFGDPEELYGDSYYINSDLYYGDTDSDSDSTIHSELSDFKLSTETLEQDSESCEEVNRKWTEATTDENQVESGIRINPFKESCPYTIEYLDDDCQDTVIDQEDLDNICETSQLKHPTSPSPEVEGSLCQDSEGSCQGEYPDEFFLFCSEAEITDMQVMEKVDMLSYNGVKDDFTYFKVEDKPSGKSSPADQDFLLESYSCRLENNESYTNADNRTKTTTVVPHNANWEGGVNGTADTMKDSFMPVYQNVPINTRLSKSNPNLASITDETNHRSHVYQNVPVPAKRYHLSATEADINNANIYDRNSNYSNYRRAEKQTNKTYTPYVNVPYNNSRREASTFDQGVSQMKPSSSLLSSLDLPSSNGHSDTHMEEQVHYRDVESMRHRSQRASQDLRFVGVSECPQFEGSFGLHNPSFLDSSPRSPAAFSAYASNTSLDHDTFSKTSKIYKWNGSSSVSDLTSLNRDLSLSPSGLARGSASATDLTRVGGGPDEDCDLTRRPSLGETSYATWSASVHDDQDDQEFVLPLGQRNTSPFVFTPHPKSGKRAMMEFYVNTLTSDSDTGSDSSTTASTSDSDTDNDDDGDVGRSYQVTAPGDGVLATIEEDAEEDSGAESSGHWLFSADNTDTDSVIHLPAVLEPPVHAHDVHQALQEGESSGSESTVVEEEEGVWGPVGQVGRDEQQEAVVVAGTSHAPIATAALTTPATDTHYDSSACTGVRDEGGPVADSAARASHSRRRSHEDQAGVVPPTAHARRPEPAMLSRDHAARAFDQHVDDVFDFESLESCESVSGGSDDASFATHDNTCLDNSRLDDTRLVFTTSATSLPFDDKNESSHSEDDGVVEYSSDHTRRPTVQTGTWGDSPHCPAHTHTFVMGCTDCSERERSTESSHSGSTPTPGAPHSDVPPVTALSPYSAFVSVRRHTYSSSEEDLASEPVEGESGQVGCVDAPHPGQPQSGPESVDLFGLPVRWTPAGEAQPCSVPFTSDTRPSHLDDVGYPSLAFLRQTEASQQTCGDDNVSSGKEPTVGGRVGESGEMGALAALPSDGETCSEASHRQHATHNLLHGPPPLSLTTHVFPAAGEALAPAGTQHDPADAMRDTRPSPSTPPVIADLTHPARWTPSLKLSELTHQPVHLDTRYTHHAHPPPHHAHPPPHHAHPPPHHDPADLPSGDSDTDTDNTDGDYDEEDHFAAELSLRISSVQCGAETAGTSFLSSDILHLSGAGEGVAGRGGAGGAPGEPGSDAGSSPEVPESVRSSESRSATRSLETLSEDSGLGDRDSHLTPISQAAPRPSLPSEARPRPQDGQNALIGRAFSCGDLRRYSESDSEDEDMFRWAPHPAALVAPNASHAHDTEHPRPSKSSFARYIEEQQQRGDEERGDARPPRAHPRPHPAHFRPHPTHPLSGSDASDEEVRSRYRGHRGAHSRPRRHRSFHEAPPSYRHDPYGRRSSEVPRHARGEGRWAVPPPPAPLPGRRRPQPISVDLAEQFLSQEGLKSPNCKQMVGNSFDAKEGVECTRARHPGAGTGGGARLDPTHLPSNHQPGGGGSTNGVSVGGVLQVPVGSRGEAQPPASPHTAELTVLQQQQRPSPLRAPPPPIPHHHPHQYSSTPAQLPNECQPVHTGQRSGGSSSPTHDPATAANAPAGSDLRQCPPADDAPSTESAASVSPEMADGPTRVRTKTYGSHGEVEVYIAKTDSGFTPPCPSPVLTPTGGAEPRPGSRGVTFSPSVKEVNWRESYYEVESNDDGSETDVQKVVVMTAESPRPQRVDLGTPAPTSGTPAPTSGTSAPTSGTPAPTSGTSAVVPTNSTVAGNNTSGPTSSCTIVTDQANGRAPDQPVGSSSSDAELSGEMSPKASTPLWQRFKLPKIPSPKTQRPKLPPKPRSLSSRSSDTESSKPSSPGLDSSSSTPSSPDSKPKKAPSSPRFFSWGSKREKGRDPPRPLVSPPPPPAQVSTRQVGAVLGREAGVKGEAEPSVCGRAVPRHDSPGDQCQSVVRSVLESQASVVCAVTGETAQVNSPASSVRGVDAKVYLADSDASHESGRSPPASVTSGDESSEAGQLHSPRTAVSKPPLPPHPQRPTQQVFHKARLLSARRQYFSQERQVSAPERSSPPKDVADSPAPAPRPPLPTTSSYTSVFDASRSLKERFERFSASARAERERLAKSTPDLSVIEASVRQQSPRIDSWSQQQQQEQADSQAGSVAWASDGDTAERSHGAPNTHHKPRASIHERYKNRAQRIYARSRTQSVGVLETDLDTGASREVLTLQETNLDDLYRDLQTLLDTLPALGAAPTYQDKARAKSLLDLEATSASDMDAQLTAPPRPPETRAKSMEFLLDDSNKASVQCQLLLEAGCEPPENELMKGSERQLSEAELRVRRSLQRLDVPDWMKNAQPQQQGFLLRRRDYSSSTTGGGGGWSAYSSKTASMTSLGSSRAQTPSTPTKVVIPTRVTSRGMTGLGGVTSPASNCSISPSPSDRSGSLFQYPISRWSTSRLNSGTTTPTGSVTSTKSTATYTRQPYLGWRSQTSLASLAGSQSSLTNTGSYLTAADRLALGITAYSQRFVKSAANTQDKENSSAEANAAMPKPESEEQNDTGSTNGSIKLQVPTDVADVHSSIKEVTSAIVHYCNESTPSPRASPRGSPRPEGRAPSPRRLVWVESSFVGSRPITSPETPTSSSHAITPTSQLNGHDLPESGEATSRPPQPPGEYLLAW
ncbi:mucin-19 isoform X5 [Procambarus clarkii]|uniref:mucin-19 isoform X5 n=1 Tax=Procambarus clarkii TaxID=6728 RepID=UPI003741F173